MARHTKGFAGMIYNYPKDGDISGARHLHWAKKNIFVPYEREWKKIRGKRVLDIGSGNGRFNLFLQKLFDEIVCCDGHYKINPKFDDDNVTFYKGDFMKLDFDGQFDAITIFLSFLYFEDKKAALERMLSLLKPDGTIVIVECVTWEHALTDKSRGRKETYNLDELTEELDLHYDYFITDETPTKCSFIKRNECQQ